MDRLEMPPPPITAAMKLKIRLKVKKQEKEHKKEDRKQTLEFKMQRFCVKVVGLGRVVGDPQIFPCGL